MLSSSLFIKTVSKLNMEQSVEFEIFFRSYLSWFPFSAQHRIWSFHVVVLQRTAKKCTKNYDVQPLFRSFNFRLATLLLP